MLQTNRSLTSPAPMTAAPEPASTADLVRLATAFLRRQYPVVLFVLLFALALAAVYLFTTPPSFTGEAKLIIDTRKVQLFQQPSILGDVSIDSASVDSQVEILKSENIARAVIKELRLTENPEFVGYGGGLLGAALNLVASILPSGDPVSEFELTRKAITAFRDRLTIKRVGLTYVIEIGFRSQNAEYAARVANAIADAYIVDQLEAKYQATRRASVWLQDRINELRQQASSAERAVLEFKTKNNIVDAGGRLMTEQQLAELNSQLILIRGQTAEAKARLERIEEIRRAEIPDATVTDTLRNDVITKLRSQYLDLSNREADWSRKYGRQHLAAVNLRNQMGEIRRSIGDELGRIAQSYKSDYEIAKAREDSIQQGLAESVAVSQTTNQAQLALRDLEGTAQTYRALHDNFLQRYMESVQQQSFPITEARLITEASRPLKKSHPKTLMVVAIAAIGGGILGIGLAMLRDISDQVYRTRMQVESALQCDCLAVIPLLKGDIAKPPAFSSPAMREPVGPRTIARQHDLLWTAIDAPFSRFAEAVRSIKVAADLSKTLKSNKVLGITSSLPNEGKSTVATSLAQLVSQSGARVVLLDCDLRNPSLTRELAPDADAGFLEVISRTQDIDHVLWTDRSTGLSFLPVVMPRVAHTSEILASEATKLLFDYLRQRFDYVIVDLPPLTPVVDVRAAAHLFDSFVFVIEWGRTKINAVEDALGGSRAVYENLLGAVLNKVNLHAMNRYHGEYSEYSANRYFARYGYTH